MKSNGPRSMIKKCDDFWTNSLVQVFREQDYAYIRAVRAFDCPGEGSNFVEPKLFSNMQAKGVVFGDLGEENFYARRRPRLFYQRGEECRHHAGLAVSWSNENADDPDV